MVSEKTRRIILLLTLVSFVFCPHILSQTQNSVSVIRLLANPERYDGKQVEVVGFLKLEFEGNMICLHKEDCENNIGENAIRIGVTKKQRSEFENKSMHYVFVAGTFKAGQPGTSNPNGTIINISNIQIWPFKEGKSKRASPGN